MSTRSNIAIKVLPTDYEKVNEKLGDNYVNDANPYLQIYSHHDGYPEHMMEELPTYYPTYEDALELVMQGDTSGTYNGSNQPYTSRGESYRSNMPRAMSEPDCEQEYLYVFEND